MSPFDLRSALLAKHAQHVVLIHFPIALFLTGMVFDIAACWTKAAAKRATLASTASLNILAAAVLVLPTLATGVAAWQWQLGGQKLKGRLLSHLLLGCASGFLICLVAWARRRRTQTEFLLPHYYIPLEILTALVVGLTAHLGGFLSGVNISG